MRIENQDGNAALMRWGEIRVELADGRVSWWKYPASEVSPAGTPMQGSQLDPEGRARGLAEALIVELEKKAT